MRKDSQKFYKDVYTLFPIHTKREKQYLKKIKKQIQECEDSSYDELQEIFGTPINVVEAYYDTVSSNYLTKRIAIKKTITITCFIVIIATLCLSAYRAYSIHQAYEDFHKQNFEWVETIEEVD